MAGMRSRTMFRRTKDMEMMRMVKGKQVTIYDTELLRRREENKKYLLELKNENLLLPYTV